MIRRLSVPLVLFGVLLGAENVPRYNQDVAPILKKHCVECHREGLSGPFSLETYDQVRRRGRQIAEVTKSGFMPPWLPSHGRGKFLGERGMSPEEIELLEKWFETGMKEGDGVPPEMPPLQDGWALGQPDLVVRPEKAYTLPGDAETDVFRNFVIRIPVVQARFVRAVDFKARDPKVVHHAIMKIDRTGKSRLLQEADEMPGYGHDMKLPHAVNPDGHFLGWTPGKRPYESSDSAWRLIPGDEMVIQLHLQPSGKPEKIQPEVGLYFTNEPPRRRAFGILLYHLELDIPPGEKKYTVQDNYTLPVDCYVRIVYPHAHFLGKSVRVLAYSPNEKPKVLLEIPEWDFNWQDSYVFRDPPFLKAGTRLEMTWVFDNSQSNIRNPNVPPKRVRYGLRTVDEMASTWFQLIPAKKEDFNTLKAYDRQRHLQGLFEKGYDELKKNPDDISAHRKLAYLFRATGKIKQAAKHYEMILKLDPKDPIALRGQGDVYRYEGRIQEALRFYQKALGVTPDDVELRFGIGVTLHQLGKLEEAEKQYLECLKLLPEKVELYFQLGNLYSQRGDRQKALEHFLKAQRLSPEHPAIQKRIREMRGFK